MLSAIAEAHEKRNSFGWLWFDFVVIIVAFCLIGSVLYFSAQAQDQIRIRNIFAIMEAKMSGFAQTEDWKGLIQTCNDYNKNTELGFKCEWDRFTPKVAEDNEPLIMIPAVRLSYWVNGNEIASEIVAIEKRPTIKPMEVIFK